MRSDKAVTEWLKEHLSVEGKVTDSTIELEGVITISKAESMHHELEEAIRLGGNITFNAESCERVDTSVLQLLACFVKEAREKELKVSIKFIKIN